MSDRHADNLARYRWHTGAEPVRVALDETVPPLFRDIGPLAMLAFLRNNLSRLAGPMTPLTYLRNADYVEPYTDYSQIGRLVLLRPREVAPWRSGLPDIYIAAATRMPAVDSIAFVPGHLPLARAAELLEPVQTADAWRERLGGSAFDDVCADTVSRLEALNAEAALIERSAARLRRLLQSGADGVCRRVRDQLEGAGITESDLCTAWHHLAPGRRSWLKEQLPRIEGAA